MKRKLFVRDHPDIASSLMILASVLNGKNEFSQAEALYREALAMNKKAFSSEHLMVAICVFALGATLHKEGKLSEAEDMLREALARSDKLLGRENYSVVDVLSELAEVLSEEGKFSEAEEILERKEALLRLQAATALKSSEKSPEKISEPVLRLAGFLQTRRKYAEAERVLNEVLTPAALSQPKSAALQSKLADLHARTGRWKEAAADFSRLIEFEPANHLYYHALAALLATSGDQGSYRGICKKIRDRFGGTTDNPNIADRMAKACLILPALGRDISTENRLADVAVRVGKTPRDEPYFQFCKGLAEYRQGNFENVEDWMRKSLMGTNSWDHIRQVEAYMVLAMAQCQLKRLSDARDSLSKGSEIARDNLPTLESGDIGEGWIDWLIAQALMREAKALIGQELEPNEPAKPEGGGLPGTKHL
jgi:tetratricopeptide (TPR) repeat protein